MLDDLTTSDTLFTDEEGYVWEVIASVIGENNKRIAWVEWREKESGRITYTDYYLQARDDSGALLVWEIQMVNAYFGCTVRFLKWIENIVVFICDDKHDTYAATLSHGGITKRIELSSEWEVKHKTLVYQNRTRNGPVTLQLHSLEEVQTL